MSYAYPGFPMDKRPPRRPTREPVARVLDRIPQAILFHFAAEAAARRDIPDFGFARTLDTRG